MLRLKIKKLWDIELLNWEKSRRFHVQNVYLWLSTNHHVMNYWIKNTKWMNWIVDDCQLNIYAWAVVSNWNRMATEFIVSTWIVWTEKAILIWVKTVLKAGIYFGIEIKYSVNTIFIILIICEKQREQCRICISRLCCGNYYNLYDRVY